MRRPPVFAGRFYERSPEILRKQVLEFMPRVEQKRKALGVVVPHAGHIYSGGVAGAVYSAIEPVRTFVLIGPNHTGLGEAISIMHRGTWDTPLGEARIDADLADALLSESRIARPDTLAHLHEHSLEVQLPFIQQLVESPAIVPIQMFDTRLETCKELGHALARAITKQRQAGALHDGVLIVASSDMSHYETAAVAHERDFMAIDRIVNLDPEGLYSTIRNHSITMCGYGPVAAMLVAAKDLGASKAELIEYAHSGEVSGDNDKVVGYAGILVM
jgi:AmmeMemoRadiSam system protein B